ncbi:hypothetical protein [Tenacibaculum mesophilum]
MLITIMAVEIKAPRRYYI